MIKTDQLVLREVTDRIVRNYRPEKVILFGSHAWGRPTPDSDFDLLVIKSTSASRRERIRQLRRSIGPARYPIDCLVYTPQELDRKIRDDRNLFLEDVVVHGKVLYDTDHTVRR